MPYSKTLRIPRKTTCHCLDSQNPIKKQMNLGERGHSHRRKGTEHHSIFVLPFLSTLDLDQSFRSSECVAVCEAVWYSCSSNTARFPQWWVISRDHQDCRGIKGTARGALQLRHPVLQDSRRKSWQHTKGEHSILRVQCMV